MVPDQHMKSMILDLPSKKTKQKISFGQIITIDEDDSDYESSEDEEGEAE